MKWLIVSILFYYGSCDDTVSVREPAATRPGADRIVGGQPTTIETYPYMVYMLIVKEQNIFACGGELLTPCHVLTAAHCVTKNNTSVRPSAVIVRAGSTYSDRGGTMNRVSSIVVHEGYNRMTMDNDVAVLVLSSRISNYNSSTVQIASIPPVGYAVPDNASVIAVGWGLTDQYCETSHPLGLRHVGLRTVNRDICAARYVPFHITEKMLCVGLLGIGGAGVCMGDSGGALEYNGVVVGVASFGKTCNDSYFPEVFVSVAQYTNWITNTVEQHSSATTAGVDFSPMILSTVFIQWIINYKV